MDLLAATYGIAENVVIAFWWTSMVLVVFCGPFLAVIYYLWLTWRAGRAERRSGDSLAKREPNTGESDDELAALARRGFALTQLLSWKVLLVVLFAAAAAIGIRIDWWFAAYPLAVSVFVASWWYGDLRRAGVVGSEVYALALWALPHVALSFALATFDEPTRPLVWQTAILSALALVLALGLLRAGAGRGPSLLVASLVLANALALYLSSRFAVPLTTGAIVVIGYTMARESRAMADAQLAMRLDEQSAQDGHMTGVLSPLARGRVPMLSSGPWQLAGTVLVVAMSSIALISGALWQLADRGASDSGSFPYFPWVTGLVLGTGIIPLAVVIYRRGTIANWGSLLLALAWVAANEVAFGYPTIDDQWDHWLTYYTAREFLAVGLAGAVILVVMWRAFGPGAYAEGSLRVQERNREANEGASFSGDTRHSLFAQVRGGSTHHTHSCVANPGSIRQAQGTLAANFQGHNLANLTAGVLVLCQYRHWLRPEIY